MQFSKTVFKAWKVMENSRVNKGMYSKSVVISKMLRSPSLLFQPSWIFIFLVTEKSWKISVGKESTP